MPLGWNSKMDKNTEYNNLDKEMEFELIAKTFMGLEPVLAQELTSWVQTMYRLAAAWYRSPETRR